MRFLHPIFICNLSETKEVEILKGMFVLFSFGFNKTKNVKNILKNILSKYLKIVGFICFQVAVACERCLHKSSVIAKKLSISILNGLEEADITVLEVTPMVTSSNNKRHWQ